MIQNTCHSFSVEQLQLLNRGPTYVLPGQMHLFFSDDRPLNTIITNEFIPLRKQFLRVFAQCSLDLPRQQTFRQAVEQQFLKSFTLPIPMEIQQHARQEQQLIRSIQSDLTENQLILRRTADDFNTFFLDSQQQFNRLAQLYMAESGCFKLMESMNIQTIVESMDRFFQPLVRRRLIPAVHHEKFDLTKKTNLTLPYLYFLPIVQENGTIQLQPRLSSCKNAPIRPLSDFLDRLFRPLYENAAQTTTFQDGHDFIQRLQNQSINVDTQFVTFEFQKFYTHMSHDDLIGGLYDFLCQQLPGSRLHWLSIEILQDLTILTLQNHYFTYEGKIYRYVKGSPLNYPFTQLLFDIFLHQWQSILIRHIRLADQLYGRYYHRGFFTWKRSKADLEKCIQELKEQNLSLNITFTIGTRTHFFDVDIENANGQLQTHLYHNPTQQPFLLPYAAEYPRILHRQWFRFRLARVIQYCPSYDDFQEESLRIELSFLTNGYTNEFVQYLSKKFFEHFNPYKYPFVNDQFNYKSLRQHIFRYYNQKKIDARRQYERERLLTLPGSFSFYYLYDWGNRVEFNQKFHVYWANIVKKDPKFAEYDFKIFLRCKQCFSSNTLFVHYK